MDHVFVSLSNIASIWFCIISSYFVANIDPTACDMHFAISVNFLKRCCLIFGSESYFTPPGFIPHVAVRPYTAMRAMSIPELLFAVAA